MYDTLIPSTKSTKIFYFVRKETTYTYDRDDNTNNNDSSRTGRFSFKSSKKKKGILSSFFSI